MINYFEQKTEQLCNTIDYAVATVSLFNKIDYTLLKVSKEKQYLIEQLENGFLIDSGHNIDKSISQAIGKHIALTDAQFNQASHKSWQTIREANECELALNAIIYYLTSYNALEQRSVHYNINYGDCNIPLRIIDRATTIEILFDIAKMLNTNVSLSKASIEAIKTVLNFTKSHLTTVFDEMNFDLMLKNNEIKNNELKVLLYEMLK